MELFSIIKPDMVNDKNALNFYFQAMKENFGIDIKNMYWLKNWIEVSKLLYELEIDTEKNIEEIRAKRKQLLITILGYYLYYKNQPAIICLYNSKSRSVNLLEELAIFKKKLRKIYVSSTDKYYLKILNSIELDYTQPLNTIHLETILVQTVVIPFNQEWNNSEYNMVFFNKLHFPEPTISSIQNEICLIRDYAVLEKAYNVRKEKV